MREGKKCLPSSKEVRDTIEYFYIEGEYLFYKEREEKTGLSLNYNTWRRIECEWVIVGSWDWMIYMVQKGKKVYLSTDKSEWYYTWNVEKGLMVNGTDNIYRCSSFSKELGGHREWGLRNEKR